MQNSSVDKFNYKIQFTTSTVYFLFSFLLLTSIGCQKDTGMTYNEADRTIQITDNINIDNGVRDKKPIFNFTNYEKFLSYVSKSDHFLIVPLKNFKNTTSDNKVVLSVRYDVDDDIDAAVKMAYRSRKYGIVSTFFILHTATYYSKKVGEELIRNPNLIFYLKKIQDSFGQEIGLHNDLVTLQLMYGISPRQYLKNELAYLRGNGINVWGTSYHGSPYCYIYKYYNAYFWYEYPDNGWNYEYITKGYKTIKIEKDSLSSYNFSYEAGFLGQDYYFADSNSIKGKRWNMGMVNLDTIQPGKKVIILLHPEHWDY